MSRNNHFFNLLNGITLFVMLLVVVGCARMGKPDGGWFDETPPRIIGCTPADGAINVNQKKIRISFNEFIKLDNAQEKVVISPPQLEQPEIKSQGRNIVVELKDSLKPNTTYTIDFGDAISDNNEGNPLGSYTYSFSTGTQIDTLEIAGYVLEASNLEPIKGILVGLYPLNGDTIPASIDSTFIKDPLLRISRCDERGHFGIRGVAPGSYRVFALEDADGNFSYTQKSEKIAFNHDIIVPSSKPDTRQDTIWRDTLHIQAITQVPYTHFLPDDIVMRAFTAEQTDRFFIKSERKEPDHFTLYFSYSNKDIPMPELIGENFDATDAFVIEPSLRGDTITYWLRDTTLVNQDTLAIEMRYLMSDSLGMLIPDTTHLELLPKTSYEKRMKEKQKDFEKWQKEQERKRKKDEPYEEVMPKAALKPKYNIPGSIVPDGELSIEIPTPIAFMDTAALHLLQKEDTLWLPREMRIEVDSLLPRRIKMYGDWEPGGEYKLDVDSLAFTDIYGLVSHKSSQQFKVSTEEELSTLSVGINLPDSATIIVQLLDQSDKVIRSSRVEDDGRAYFFYLKPSTYYLRAFVDSNDNGIWDTGDYYTDRQPEAVYYCPDEIECKAKWDIKREWNPLSLPLYRQKPGKLVKQKTSANNKKQTGRNLKRALDMGIDTNLIPKI